MSSFQLTGRVVHVGTAQQKTEKFSLRPLRIVTQKKYGETVKDITYEFTFTNKNMEKLDRLVKGDEVTVDFEIESREYNGRVYSELRGWKVNVLANAGGGSKAAQSADNDDLPF